MILPFPSGSDLPDHIQFLPPGRTCVMASDERDLPTRVEVVADEDLAVRLDAQVQYMIERAKADESDWPFVDFGHQRMAAAGWVHGILWGGVDPKRGGIRASISWSDLGAFALRCGVFRRFSPDWFVDRRSHLFIGIGACVGGLTNLAAFASIQSVAGVPVNRPAGEAEATEFCRLVASMPGGATDSNIACAAEARPDLHHAWSLLQPVAHTLK